MEIRKSSIAGSLESSDLMVEVSPGKNGREIILKSVVEKQYYETIMEVVVKTLDDYGVNDIVITINDRGALDFAIRSRVETALLRAGGDA